jgi:endonuclease YncB( thermonuclease family)
MKSLSNPRPKRAKRKLNARPELRYRNTNMIAAAFLCLVTHVHDGDGPLWCGNGIKVRVAGIQAPDFESAEPCRLGKAAYVCSDVQAKRSRAIVQRLVMGKTLTCQPVGKSYERVVARCTLPDGRSLSCAAIAAGAATRWDSYWRRYGMGECR